MKNLNVLFAVLNVVQGALIIAIPLIVSSRISMVNHLLFASGALMVIAGPALAFGGVMGQRVATLACFVHGVFGTVVVSLIIFSASYLYGIYGYHGIALGAMATVLAVLVLTVFWLVPAHELHYLRRIRGQK